MNMAVALVTRVDRLVEPLGVRLKSQVASIVDLWEHEPDRLRSLLNLLLSLYRVLSVQIDLVVKERALLGLLVFSVINGHELLVEFIAREDEFDRVLIGKVDLDVLSTDAASVDARA